MYDNRFLILETEAGIQLPDIDGDLKKLEENLDIWNFFCQIEMKNHIESLTV